MLSDYCRLNPIAEHTFRDPQCQLPVTDERDMLNYRVWPGICGHPASDFQHNDSPPLDDPRKHPLVPPETLTRDNSFNRNDCPIKYDDDGCSCICHWQSFHVNAYLIDRNYGGPEEGGWWYDSGMPIASMPADTWGEAQALAEEWRGGRFPNTGKRYSVLGGEDYDVVVEPTFAERFPSETQHYE